MRIALDAMGGDFGPRPNVAGALKALAASPDLTVILVGDRAQIDPLLEAGGGFPADRLEVLHAAEVIGMHEKPTDGLRKKPDNSISRCWQLLGTKKVAGLVSAGNTGAVVAGGLITRRFLKSVRRPGIAAVMPSGHGKTVILDVGANVFPKPAHLLQYGVMGSVFAREMFGVAVPKIGLMNVGEEQGKGHDLVQQTFDLFRNGPLKDRFVGNVEGRDVHKGIVDVIVTDGFVGNVILKHAEGLSEYILQMVSKDVIGALGAEQSLAATQLKSMVAKLHYSAAGGAPLLGIDGVCIICHGSSDERAIANAVSMAAKNVRVGLNDKITEELAALPPMDDD